MGLALNVIENHKVGKLRVVAVKGMQRQASLPEVPTFTDVGNMGLYEVP